MNKTELVAAVAAKSGLTKKDADRALTSMLDTITTALQNGDKVQLLGFGSFEVKTRGPRLGRNPVTQEKLLIEEKTVPAFRAGVKLREAVK